MTTEAEQIAAVCEWLGLEYPTQDITIHGYYDPVIWWSREGWWKALAAWVQGKRGARSYTQTADEDGYRLYLWEWRNDEEKQQAMNRGVNHVVLFTAALAALTEAMEHE